MKLRPVPRLHADRTDTLTKSTNSKAATLRRGLFLLSSFAANNLLQVNHLPGRIQRAMHSDSLAGKLLHFILMIEVVGLPGSVVVQHIAVARFYNHSAKDLSRARLR